MNDIIVFDGNCNVCDASVRFVLRWDRSDRFVFASNQSQIGLSLLARHGVRGEYVGSVYLVEGDHIYAKSTAALRIARFLGFPWCVAYSLILLPRGFRDWAYDAFARNRYRWFGRRESCRVPTERERARFIDQVPEACDSDVLGGLAPNPGPEHRGDSVQRTP